MLLWRCRLNCAPAERGLEEWRLPYSQSRITSGRQHYVKPEQAASEVKGFKDKQAENHRRNSCIWFGNRKHKVTVV
ncbi:unnamed protein product [Boreogadus saida]